jgi:opacity protein-like surface antigen
MGQTGLALALGQTMPVYAADLGLPPPPPLEEPCVGCVGPWYLKGFVGAANPVVGGIDYELHGPNFEFIHEDMKSTPLFGLGLGYDTGHYFRFDITGEYRGKGLFIAQDRYRGPTGSFALDLGGGTNEYTADIESWVGLFNTYIDLGTWHCVTPYIGGGVGFASISVLGYKDVNVPNRGVAFGRDHTETNFAWAVYGGLAYQVTPGLTLDLGYRYTDLGDAKTGKTFAYDNSTIAGSFEINDITSHDLLFSVRLALGKQPAPMPVAFK